MEHLIKSQKNKPQHTNEQKVNCETREAPLGDDNRSEQVQTGFSFVPIRVSWLIFLTFLTFNELFHVFVRD